MQRNGQPLAGQKPNWWVLGAIGTATFMSALDGSVVNSVLPVIRAAFKAGVATVEWVVVIYLLVVSGLLLTFGRLGDLRGHKQVFITGFLVFILGSACCGFAPSAGWLVAARGLQALGGAVLFANSPAILTRNFPPERRGQVLGLSATMTYLGLTTGPVLGGWLTDTFGWRAIFFINIPIGLLAFLLSLRYIPSDAGERKAERFDVAGALAFMTGLVALLLGLNQGAEWGWGSPLTLGLLAGAAVLLAAFIFIEGRVAAPMLDLSLFDQRVFSMAALSAVLNYVALYGITFLLPFYLLQGRGLSPSQAGLVLSVQPLVMAVAAPLSGTLSDRVGSRGLATAGMLILAAALGLLSTLGPGSSLGLAAGGLGLAGLGTGVFISPNSSALMGSAPRHRQGIASGILATARNVGMVLGVGLAGAILTSLFDSAAPASLFEAVRAGLLAASVAALLSSLAAALRGREAQLARQEA